MGSIDTSASENRHRPYRHLREDPRYPELKRIIEDFPPEKLAELRSYIKRWLRSG